VAFPLCQLGVEVLQRILAGGAERVQAAGAVIAGGHSIEDDEPKYGMCVTGIVDPGQMLTTCGCQPGDQLLLTKPLGTGLLATALKGEVLQETEIEAAVAGMIRLNDSAAAAVKLIGGKACTDVTGFGLVGHALELAEASGVTLRLSLAGLPAYPRALEMAGLGLVPEGAYRNRDYYFPRVVGPIRGDQARRDLLCDPQTSGGLLIAVATDRLKQLQQHLSLAGVPAYHVGEAISGLPGRLELSE